MPAQAAVTVAAQAGLAGGALFAATVAAIVIDAYLIGALLAPDDPGEDLGSLNINVRSASEPHSIVYGRTMVGGTLVLLDALDHYELTTEIYEGSQEILIKESRSSGEFLHMAVALASHPIDGIEEVWIGQDKVFETNRSGELRISKNKYRGYVDATFHNGKQNSADKFIVAGIDHHYDGKNVSNNTLERYYKPQGVTNVSSGPGRITIDNAKRWDSQDPIKIKRTVWVGGKEGQYETINETIGSPKQTYDFSRTSKDPRNKPKNGVQWDTDYILSNTAYLYLRLKYNPNLFKGLPKVKAVIRGKKVYDPRWDEDLVNPVDRGDWTKNTVYSLNDKVTSPNGKSYICQLAHTSVNFDWTNGGFDDDFIKNRYWKKAQKKLAPNSWEWSDNWALCLRDYLTSGNYRALQDDGYSGIISNYGIGLKDNEIDENNIIEAANVSDELVYYRTGSESVVSKSFSGNKLTIEIAGDQRDWYNVNSTVEMIGAGGVKNLKHNIITTEEETNPGDGSELFDSEEITEALYTCISSIYDSGPDRTELKFKAPENISVTAVRLWATRFNINGVVSTGNVPLDILENLLASGSGKLPYVQGKFLLIPGIYLTPTVTIDESNLAGPVEVKGSLGSSELINTVTGTFRDPGNFWEETNFKKQFAQEYIDADGGYELVKNVKYVYTTSYFDAQRLARITLQRAREGVSCTLTCNLSVMELVVGQFIYVSLERLGWNNKIFSITSWSLDNNTITLALREENSVAYDWTGTKLDPIEYMPDTDLEIAPDLTAVTNFTASSGTSELISLEDGTIVPRVKVSWDTDITESTDLQVYGNLVYSVKPFNIDDDVVNSRVVRIDNPDIGSYYIDEVREGDVLTISLTLEYDDPNVQIAGESAEIESHVVVGKNQVPANVSGFNSTIDKNLLLLSWMKNTEIDFSHFEIRSGASWETGTFVDTTTSTSYYVTGLVYGVTTYWIKAVDTSGNESATAISTIPDITSPGAVASVSYTINENNITLDWSEAVKGSFAIAGYRIRYGNDSVFENNTFVSSVDTREFSIISSWLGTRVYRVVPVDIYGNVGEQNTISITINTPNAPNLSPYTLERDRVEFTWTVSVNSSNQFPIEYYEIARGSDPVWENNTFILFTATKGYSRIVTWLSSVEPTRTFRVRAVDTKGNVSPAATIGVSIAEPGDVSITSQIIDNNVLLTWTEPTITENVNLPINYYEVRKGSSYGSSELIGNLSGLFAAIFENAAGTYTYWVTPFDTAGNSGSPISITARVNEPPDYLLLANATTDFVTVDSNWIFHSTINGFITEDSSLLMPADTTQTWATHFTNNSWTDIQDQIDAGFPIYIQPTPIAAVYSTIYDVGSIQNNLSITTNIDKTIIAGDPVATLSIYTALFNAEPTGTNDTLDATGVTLHDTGASFLTTVNIGATVSNDTDGSTGVVTQVTDDTHLVMTALTDGFDNQWQVNDVYTVDNYVLRESTTQDSVTVLVSSFRFILMAVYVSSAAADTDIYKLNDLNMVIDIKEKTESGNSTTNGSGVDTVTFTKEFSSIKSISLTPNISGGDNIVAVYDYDGSPNPTTFDVYTFNGEDGSVAANIDYSWVIRGY